MSGVVARLQAAADQIEREAKHNITSAGETDRREYATYGRVAQAVLHEVHYAVVNAHLENVIDAASDAEAARTEKLATPAEESLGDIMASRKAGVERALRTMLSVAEGWAETSHENQVAMDHRDVQPVGDQTFVLADIRTMINDAGREAGLADPIWVEKGATS